MIIDLLQLEELKRSMELYSSFQISMQPLRPTPTSAQQQVVAATIEHVVVDPKQTGPHVPMDSLTDQNQNLLSIACRHNEQHQTKSSRHRARPRNQSHRNNSSTNRGNNHHNTSSNNSNSTNNNNNNNNTIIVNASCGALDLSLKQTGIGATQVKKSADLRKSSASNRSIDPHRSLARVIETIQQASFHQQHQHASSSTSPSSSIESRVSTSTSNHSSHSAASNNAVGATDLISSTDPTEGRLPIFQPTPTTTLNPSSRNGAHLASNVDGHRRFSGSAKRKLSNSSRELNTISDILDNDNDLDDDEMDDEEEDDELDETGDIKRSSSGNGKKGVKAHLCNHCGRSFSRSDMLTRHSRLHSGVKPYQCLECKQVFSRSDHLSTHERTHTGEKPYQCTKCNYSACRRDMITRHMRTHSETRSPSTTTSDEWRLATYEGASPDRRSRLIKI